MNIIFLDIDGVLSLSDDEGKRTSIREGLTVPYLWNEDACREFNDILTDCNCEVVMSSDWRKLYRLPEMREIFDFNKIEGKRLIGYTPTSKAYRYSNVEEAGFQRSEEINSYLALHGIKEWIAIDDLDLTGLVKHRFIRTEDTKGILGHNAINRIRRVFE